MTCLPFSGLYPGDDGSSKVNEEEPTTEAQILLIKYLKFDKTDVQQNEPV